MQQLKELADALCLPLYALRGRRPWTAGYYTTKRRTIEQAIDLGWFRPGGVMPEGYGRHLDERVVEYPWIYARIPRKPGAVLDAGSALNHGFLLQRPPVSEAELTICTLAPEKRCYWNRGISYMFDDLRHTRFASAVFDVVVSISTIEHIGLDNTMLYTADSSKREHQQGGYLVAVREFRRIVKPGGICMITVPFGRAANHGWFQVFDAAMVDSILETFRPSDAEVQFFGYSDSGWAPAQADTLKEATFFDIHATREYDSDFAAGARAVACMRLVA